MYNTLKFIRAFLTRPSMIGAIAPSSRRLALKMIEWIDWPEADVVIEYGPGTGVFTESIFASLRPGTRFFAIELESTFVATLKEQFPALTVYCDSVANVQDLCREQGVETVDAVVSGLPWAAFPQPQQQQFLDAMMTVLKTGGQFVTFAYLQGLPLPSGRRFRRMLQKYFSEVTTSRTEWLNLPPAIVYRCRR